MTIISFIAINFGAIYRTTKSSYRDSPTFGNILLDVASEKPKALFFLTELMPFKLKYNSHFYNILVQN